MGMALLLPAATGYAHVGSRDVYAEGQAGPYRLSVVVRPPLVIPGVAEIEVRAQTAGVDGITVTPVPLTGEAAKHPPVADAMERNAKDGQFFTGRLWIMATDSWQIRFAASGSQGSGVLSIPLPATAMGTRRMEPGMGIVLAALGIVLMLGMVGIVGAATSEAKLAPGDAAPRTSRRRGYIAMTVTFALLLTGVILGNRWWKSDAADYSRHIYKPLEMTPALQSGNVLDLKLTDPGWVAQRRLDDFVPDHDHLMHLYLIRWLAMDVVFHLHPEPVATGEFQLALPSVPAGDYRLYADVVHAVGFPETMVASMTLPQIAGRPLAGDDAEGTAGAVGGRSKGGQSAQEERFSLPDGYTMIWKKPDALVPKVPVSFQFELLDGKGNPPVDMALYMGMPGHAAFVKTDGTVFAHIHPNGTVSMAAFMMANPQGQTAANDGGPGMDMLAMTMGRTGTLSNVVSFPYGFPTAGWYRIFVQMKHRETVETGVFDAQVKEPGK
jgi:hypothetical protein